MKKIKVYVEELPKECWDCPCFKTDLECPCGLSDGTQDYFKDEIDGENCPLKLLKTHDRELVKEVLGKVKRKVDYISMHTVTKERLMIMCEEIRKEFEDE